MNAMPNVRRLSKSVAVVLVDLWGRERSGCGGHGGCGTCQPCKENRAKALAKLIDADHPYLGQKSFAQLFPEPRHFRQAHDPLYGWTGRTSQFPPPPRPRRSARELFLTPAQRLAAQRDSRPHVIPIDIDTIQLEA